jgi:hypothetical protein
MYRRSTTILIERLSSPARNLLDNRAAIDKPVEIINKVLCIILLL